MQWIFPSKGNEMKAIKTGITSFDWYLKGGLAPTVFLLVGIPGSGTEIFARQIAYNCAVNDKISYFTVNSNGNYIKKNMLDYGFNVDQLEKNGSWRNLQINKENNLVNKVISEMDEQRTVIIDSLSELILQHKLETVIDLITQMCLKNNGSNRFHMLLLTEGMQDQKVDSTIKHFAEGVIEFNMSWMGNSHVRYLFVKKNQGAIVPARRLEYSLSQNGIVIETAKRIN